METMVINTSTKVDSSTQTVLSDAISCWWPVVTLRTEDGKNIFNAMTKDIHPGVPCHILSSIVGTLNTQISWLLVSVKTLRKVRIYSFKTIFNNLAKNESTRRRAGSASKGKSSFAPITECNP